MKKGILLFVALTMFYFVADAQSVFVDIQESDGGCGLQTDCESNIACFDLVVTVDQADWELASYNVWTQYPAPPLMSHRYDNACLTQNGGDTDDNINGQYRVAGINGIDLLVPNTPTVFHTICYDYADEGIITDSVIASGGTLNIYGTPFFSTMTLSHTITGVTAGLTIPQQYFLDLNSSTLSCLAPDVLIEKAMIANADNDGSGSITVGDVLTYRVKATNAGNIALNNVLVSDPKLIPSSTLCNLLPAGDSCILIGTYTVQQADVNAGEIINTASVVSDEVGPFEVVITTPVPNNPETSIVKTLLTDISGGVKAGDVLNYSVVVTNTGDMTLTNVVVADPKLTPNSISCGLVLPGASCTLSGFYAVKLSDMNNGEIINIATGNSNQTPEVIDTLITTLPQTPNLTIEKILISDTTGGIQVGEALIYYIEIVNTGNITLHNVTISDPTLTPNTKICPAVAPNGICILTGTYTVKQSDMDAGQVVNNATGSSNETPPEPVQVITPITQNPETTTVKTLLTDISGGVAEGDILEYQIVVTNSGNITLHNVSVSDPVLTPDLATCDSLVPGAACTLTGTYTLSQDDVDDAEFENTGTGDSDETDPDPDILITPLPQNPELLVEKSTPDSTYFEIGQIINYTIEVTNTGNVTISNISLSDPEADAASITCTATELLPGESLTCTAIHTVDQDDMFAGEVINVANANGDDPLGNSLSQPSNTVVVSIQIILANDDTGIPVNGMDGGEAVPNVLANDLLSGLPVDSADITLTETVPDPTGSLILNPDGSVDVAPGTPAGIYTLTYQICENLNMSNCDDALVMVTVVAAPIVAVADSASGINGYSGQDDVLNIFDNDLLNGNPVDLADITLFEILPDPNGYLTLNNDGGVDLAPGTPAGIYTLTYQICENLNLMNCDEALVKVTVVAAPIVAVADSAAGINGYSGQDDVLNIFDNDLLNGDPVDPAELTLFETVPDPTGSLILNPDGSVDVAPGTPAGIYTLTYQICEELNPTNCDDALVKVTVVAAPIVAVADSAADINGYTGTNDVLNIFDNDLLNGDPVDPAELTLTETVPDPTGSLSLNPDGSVDVASGTPAGIYTLTYQICENLNISNCDDALVKVTVVAAPIVAVADSAAGINGYTGQDDVLNIFDNDLLNGDPVDPADVTLFETVPDPTGSLILNPDGSVDVAPGTPAGIYTLTYQICENLNMSNCDDAIVKVTVFEEPAATFCFNNEEAQAGTGLFFCSTESIAFTLCDLASGQAPLTICWEVDGVPDCELIVYVGDTLFIEFLTPGDYQVNITSITDNLGNSVTDLGEYNFDVSVSEGSSANVGGNNTICQGTNQVMDNASASGYSSLLWSGGDGVFVPSNDVLNPMYIPGTQDILDGTVDLCLTALPLAPCNTPFVDCMTLSILKNPVVNVGSDITVCETDNSIDLSAITENGQSMFWSSTGNGFFTSEDTETTTYFTTVEDALQGSIDLCLTLLPVSPCVIPGNDCMTLTIIQAPESFAGSDKSVCEGDAILLDDGSVQNAQGVAWSTDGDGTFADISSINTTYYPGSEDITIGNVQLCLTAQPMDGCTAGTESCLNLNIIKQPSSDLQPILELDCADYDVDNGEWLPVDLSNTITGDYIAVEWTTNGDGTFDDANAVSPNYYPGLGDIWKGDIELCINIEAAGICQFNTSQCLMLYIPQQLIYFNKNGWWGISSYLETDLPTVPEVMDPLVLIPGSQHLVTMVDKAGTYFWPEATPPGGNLSEWMPVGYKIKMKNTPACLPIYGDSLADQSFLVNGNFTFLPVLTNIPVSVDSLLQGHFNDVILIYHWAKNELWTPAASDFDFLYPGYAYLMVNRFGTTPYTVEYPDYVPDAPHLYPVQVTKDVLNNSPWEDVQNTAQPHILLFSDNALGKLKPGDILGAFSEVGECFGMAEYNDKDALYKLIAMGYSGFTSEDRGFLAGDEMLFKVYRQDRSEEMDVTLIFDPDYPSSDGIFAVNGVSMVVDMITTITAVEEQQSDSFMLNLYPNPASDILNLVSDTKIVEVKIMNSSGQLVMQNTPNSTQAVLDVSGLSAGIYMVAVKNSHQQTLIQRVSIR